MRGDELATADLFRVKREQASVVGFLASSHDGARPWAAESPSGTHGRQDRTADAGERQLYRAECCFC